MRDPVPMVDPEEVDLARLCDVLRHRCSADQLAGYLVGKTAMRNAIVEATDLSQLQAEELVDLMESRGLIHFEGDAEQLSAGIGAWTIGGSDASVLEGAGETESPGDGS